MPPLKSEDKPVVGERVEVYNYVRKDFETHDIKNVLHQGMNGWTIETSMGLLIDVIPTEYKGQVRPAWREYIGKH